METLSNKNERKAKIKMGRRREKMTSEKWEWRTGKRGCKRGNNGKI